MLALSGWSKPCLNKKPALRFDAVCAFVRCSLAQLRVAEPVAPSLLVSETLAAKRAARVAAATAGHSQQQQQHTSVDVLSPRGPLSRAQSMGSLDGLCSANSRCSSATSTSTRGSLHWSVVPPPPPHATSAWCCDANGGLLSDAGGRDSFSTTPAGSYSGAQVITASVAQFIEPSMQFLQ